MRQTLTLRYAYAYHKKRCAHTFTTVTFIVTYDFHAKLNFTSSLIVTILQGNSDRGAYRCTLSLSSTNRSVEIIMCINWRSEECLGLAFMNKASATYSTDDSDERLPCDEEVDLIWWCSVWVDVELDRLYTTRTMIRDQYMDGPMVPCWMRLTVLTAASLSVQIIHHVVRSKTACVANIQCTYQGRYGIDFRLQAQSTARPKGSVR